MTMSIESFNLDSIHSLTCVWLAPIVRGRDNTYHRSIVPTFPSPARLHDGRSKPFPELESVAPYGVDFLITAGVMNGSQTHKIHVMSYSPGVSRAPPLPTPATLLWEVCHLFENC